MATYPSDPNLDQYVDGVTVIDAAQLNALVDNVNAIGAALADIAAEDGQIHLGAGDKRIYFNGGSENMRFDTGDSRFELSDDLSIQNTIYCENVEFDTGATLSNNPGNGAKCVGNFWVNGTLSKSAGSFKIDHPLDENRNLYHGFIEGPEYGLLYRGIAEMEAGGVEIDIDEACGMIPGTFDALAMNPTIYLQNISGFGAVMPSELKRGKFRILCQDTESSDRVSWLVCAERKDKFVMESDSTDENGHLILEPLKERGENADTD